MTPLVQEKVEQENKVLPDGTSLEQRIHGNRQKILADGRRREKIMLDNKRN